MLQKLKIKDFITSNGTIQELQLSYEVFGRPLYTAPVVLVNHALTGNSTVTGEKGWWSSLIGPNRCIDTEYFTVLAFNIPGNGYDGFEIKNYKDFVAGDIANVFLRALEQLDVRRLYAIIGGSLGGGIGWEMVALEPQITEHLIPIAADWKSTDWLIANCRIQEQFLVNSSQPIHDARMHAMLCYRTPESFKSRFNRSVNEELGIFNVESWLLHHGKKLQERFQLSAYKLMNQLLRTIDIQRNGDSVFQRIWESGVKIQMVGVNTDLFFLPGENLGTLTPMNQNIRYAEIESIHGHDAFLIEFEQLEEILAGILKLNWPMSEQKFETQAIRTQLERTQYLEHAAPLFLTSSYVFEDAEDMRASFAEEKERNIYSRYSNPNTSEFVDKVCKMEGAESGFAFASGMSAVFSTFAALLDSGDHILSSRSVFGSTHSLYVNFFPKWNIETGFFEVGELGKIEGLIQDNTKVIYVESPTNPGVDVIDLEVLGRIAKKHKLIFIVDNCFASPYLQQPIKFGADLVIHSGTKLMDGQGRVLAGVTVGKASLIEKIYRFSRITGPALSPFNAWVLSKSLETLAIRVDRHCENALKLAEFLEGHNKVNWVKYPFLKSHPKYEIAKKQMKAGGCVVAFEVNGGLESGRRFFDNIKLLSLSANLGDSRSIVTHPASTTHSKLSEEERLKVGITDGMVRVSVGLEHIDDILSDIQQALES